MKMPVKNKFKIQNINDQISTELFGVIHNHL